MVHKNIGYLKNSGYSCNDKGAKLFWRMKFQIPRKIFPVGWEGKCREVALPCAAAAVRALAITPGSSLVLQSLYKYFWALFTGKWLSKQIRNSGKLAALFHVPSIAHVGSLELQQFLDRCLAASRVPHGIKPQMSPVVDGLILYPLLASFPFLYLSSSSPVFHR